MTVTIVDYGAGNLGSLLNMFRRLNVDARLENDAEGLRSADVGRILIPGVGAFDHGASGLQKSGLGEAIREAAQRGVPILGICLGMQLLTDGSAEGVLAGLSIIPGRCKKFDPMQGPKRVPHMGWNWADPAEGDSLIQIGAQRQRFYFAHSYYVDCTESHVRAWSDYSERFPSVIGKDNVLGAQFHPEKSHTFGMRFLENFSRWTP